MVPRLEGTPRHLVFREHPETTCQLIYGNSRTPAPEYDLARLTPREDLGRTASGELGPRTTNTAQLSPEPWSERHPVVLWLALGVGVAVLGFLALRSLHYLRSSPSP